MATAKYRRFSVYLPPEHVEAAYRLAEIHSFVSQNDNAKVSPLVVFLIGQEAAKQKLPGWRRTLNKGIGYESVGK